MWPDSDETRELLKSAESGDAQAVNELMERHRGSLRKMVQMRLDRAVSGRVDASDVIQEVLIEASGRLSEYIRDAKLPFHLWLRQLAQDHIIDMYRRHRVAKKRSVDREQPLAAPATGDRSSLELAAMLRDSELTPAANMRRELESRFSAALDRLSEDDRDIILMRHYEHLSNIEVAEVLNSSSAAAGMRHLRALRRLRSILDHS